MTSSDWIAAASLAVSIVALFVSWFAIWRSNRTTSAATFVSLNEGFRQAWTRFFDASPQTKSYELAELLNLLEIGCAIYLEGSLSGNARKLTLEYLRNVLQHLVEDDYTNAQIPVLLQAPHTFIFIRRFLNQKVQHLSVTIPPRWHQMVMR